MDKFKTNAKKASQEINRLSKESYSIPTSWNHLDSKLNSIILETTLDEVGLYWDIKTYLRPGYSTSDKEINVPILFTKINGTDYKIDSMLKELKESSSTIFLDNKNNLLDDKPYTGDINLNDEKWMNTFIFKEFSFLNQQYQKKFKEALIELIDNKKDYFTDHINDIKSKEMIMIISRIQTFIFQKYMVNDFQYTTPKIVLEIHEAQLDLEESIVCFFLGMLGFDVVIVNVDGFSDIENYVQSKLLNVFISQGSKAIVKQESKPLAIRKKMLISVGAGLLAIMVGGAAINIGGMSNGIIAEKMIEETIQTVAEEKVETQTSDEVTDVTTLDSSENTSVSADVESNNMSQVNRDMSNFSVNLDYPGFTFYEKALYRFVSTSPNEMPSGITKVKIKSSEATEYEQLGTINNEFFYEDLERDLIKPGLWLYNTISKDIKGDDGQIYMYTLDKKVVVDGTRDVMELSTGSDFKVDLFQKATSFDNKIISSITDEYGNQVSPLVKATEYYEQVDLNYIFTDESGFSVDVQIDTWQGLKPLVDGKYKVSIAETGIASVIDFELVSDTYIIENGVIMKDVEVNSSPTVLSDPIEIDCREGELVLINIEEIFMDDDIDDKNLYVYEQTYNDFYFDEEGVVGPYYAIQITPTTRDKIFLKATDGKSPAVMKEIKLNVN